MAINPDKKIGRRENNPVTLRKRIIWIIRMPYEVIRMGAAPTRELAEI